MDFEESLKSFRLHASADRARERVLRGAGRARFEQRLWRWTWAAAAAVVALAVPINAWVERAVRPAGLERMARDLHAVPDPLREEGIRDRARMALLLPLSPRTLPEDHP